MKYIQLEPQGDIAIVRINRPEALNAMNTDVISELSKAIDIIGADDSIKVVIITGAGERSFCAGADGWKSRLLRLSTALPLAAAASLRWHATSGSLQAMPR
jgi:enoyl-CoA hydratase/carnithine racemase